MSLKMTLSENLKVFFSDVVPVVTSGILTVVLLSCALFCIQTCFNLAEGIFSLGAGVVQRGHIHRLFLYPYYHQTFTQLLLNMSALMILCGSVEKSVGTVRFLSLFSLLSFTTGLICSFLDLLLDESMKTHTEGLLPVTLAFVAMATMHTKMTRGFLCGVSFPSVALPWVLLIICTVVVPRSSLLCNVLGILMGWVCGKGWLSLIYMSEAKATVLEKIMPFRLMRKISGVMFIPASPEERRKTLLPQINPSPGSYPVQTYAPLSSINPDNTTAATYEGWPHLTNTFPSSTPPLNHSAHGVGHNHGHISGQTVGHSCSHSHG